ncbi:MAG: Eco57I restriction-modification methylase domain-containing protein [Dehalococcoidia bacterium]
MNIDTNRVRDCLKRFDFDTLFIEELGWNTCNNRPSDIQVDSRTYHLIPFAEQGGMVVYLGESPEGGVPPSNIRRIIDTKIRKQTHEHMIIFVDEGRTRSVWQWVRRQRGKQTAAREYTYSKGQPGDSLLQKLAGIAFSIEDLDEEGTVAITEVTSKVTKALDLEKVTRRFYDEFKKEHINFSRFLKGLEGQDDLAWYTSVMLDRLMFIYFIQKKGFLDGDADYLANKLGESKGCGSNQFYRKFLVRLFFEGFAREESDRSPEVNQLLGRVPYLNGGLFLPHQLELAYGERIEIPDAAFEGLFAFFDRYNWHLDYRPLRADNEINPDVLGYIFEKYVNQKQMGAYYTKEDITGYICQNTIIPFLFDKLESKRYDELHPFPMKDVEPYIYDAVKQEDYLPTETEREYRARQKRYRQIKDDFAAGKIAGINDLINYNLDIRKFAQDWVRGIKDPVTLRAFYFHCLTKVTILDPAVGSGAFLFAALNLLEPLYEICLDKMEELGGPKYQDFAEELARVNQHPNRKYFVFKSIIVNNLFGVDIMEEAVEICKLRLFLKLASQVEDVDKIEPLPDIDFNIRAGNSLVGYVNEEEIKKAKATQLDLSGALKGIEERIQTADRALQSFRSLQTRLHISASELAKAKAEVKDRLAEIQGELNRDLAAFYGAHDIDRFVQTHQPFHWLVEFYGIIKGGGFDVVIGNPPFLEQRQVNYSPRNFRCNESGAIHAMFIETGLQLLHNHGCLSMIMPMALVSTQRMKVVQELLEEKRSVWYCNYSWRPGKLFETVNRAITIVVGTPAEKRRAFSTNYQKWISDDRRLLMQRIRYVEVPRERPSFWVPKFGREIERSLLGKCLNTGTTLGKFMGNSEYRIYYRTTGGLYWKVFTDFPPAFRINGKVGHSSRETWFSLVNAQMVNTAIAALGSDVFWWWYTITTNCRDLNPYDLRSFPIPESALYDPQLAELGSEYLEDLQRNSVMLVRDQRQTGHTETQLFKIQKSKPIISQIDRVLAKHYGFTEEELDFIINYDIKYRMGKDGGDD